MGPVRLLLPACACVYLCNEACTVGRCTSAVKRPYGTVLTCVTHWHTQVRAYPVVETHQRDSICHLTICPARAPRVQFTY
jgi:hypothetical protein